MRGDALAFVGLRWPKPLRKSDAQLRVEGHTERWADFYGSLPI